MRRSKRWLLAALGLLVFESVTAAAPLRRAVYAEALGRGGLYGIGYEQELVPGVVLGAVASYYALRGDHVATLAGYLGGPLLTRGQGSWFLHGGSTVTLLRTPSPVAAWSGRTELGVSATLVSGYERRAPLLVRVYAACSAGVGGFAPWAGLTLGWSR